MQIAHDRNRQQQREAMQAAGFQFSETYYQFVRRVTDELEV